MRSKSPNPKQLRHRLGMSQTEFWGRIGVTQSGGSRYENGRPMPRPVQALLRLVHVERFDLSDLDSGDIRLIGYLKHSEPRLYRNLRKTAQNQHRRRS
ncbi:MAG: helix-turn-helix domain-containing protein [Pseudomonadota bacterium]